MRTSNPALGDNTFSGFGRVAREEQMSIQGIEQGAASGALRFMEWYAAFGLMVTLIWLYLEILRLLMKLRSRD